MDFNKGIGFPQKKNDILTIGEILIDMISDNYQDEGEWNTFHKHFGGSPSNIAVNVKNLGANATVAAAVGKDRFGEFLLKTLQKADIDTRNIQMVDYSTSLVVVGKSKSTPESIFYRNADYNLEYLPELKSTLLDSKIVHFSCWPISMLPSRITIEKVIEKAKENNILIGFDPNYHPMIWQNGEDGRKYIKSIIKKVDIIKPSRDDAERIFGKDTDENYLKYFLDLGAKLVIMTLGEDGALVSNGKETIRFESFAQEVVDTTGAGDAFWSGFYTAMVKGSSIIEALKLGFAVSAYKLKFTGAVVDLPTLDVIKEIYNL